MGALQLPRHRPGAGLDRPRSRRRGSTRDGDVERREVPRRRSRRFASCCARYRPVPVPGLPRFSGGAVGYLGYDLVRLFESCRDAP